MPLAQADAVDTNRIGFDAERNKTGTLKPCRGLRIAQAKCAVDRRISRFKLSYVHG